LVNDLVPRHKAEGRFRGKMCQRKFLRDQEV